MSNTMKKILILNGPNLNMLGLREPHIYGSSTLPEIEGLCREEAAKLNIAVDFRQSNHEGELVTWIQDARGVYDGVIINAAAYTHTSVAIHDALKLLEVPVVEVHLSDPKTRETFRHHSYIESVAQKGFAGQGPKGYILSLQWLSENLRP